MTAHDADRRDLVAHQADGLGLRADEDEAALLHALGEIGVLGQKAVAGMDGDRIGYLRGADDRRHVQVAQRRGRRADADRLVRQQHVLQIGIGGGVHGDGLDAQFAAGAQDAQRDFAAIGDDDFLQHTVGAGVYWMMNSGWPNSTGSPFFTMIALIVPAFSDSI